MKTKNKCKWCKNEWLGMEYAEVCTRCNRSDWKEIKKYCSCKSGLILANLEEGKGNCPICNLPKKLNKRLKLMSKIYKNKKGAKEK